MQVAGAHVFITGGSRGIGAALAREFANAGANVSVAARSEDTLRRVADEVGGTAFVTDLTDDAQVDGLIARVEAEAGPIDILVNNAGLETDDQLAAVDVDKIRSVARVNYEVPVVLTRQVIRGMHARGGGHLVYLSSLAGSAGFPSLAVYSGTKSGINNFVAAMRLELSSTEIGTTIVAPGPVDTAMWDQLEEASYTDDMLKRLRALFLIPMISPDRLAKRVVRGVESGRRHVRHPRRAGATFMFPEVSRRLTEMLMTGVHFPPPPPPES